MTEVPPAYALPPDASKGAYPPAMYPPQPQPGVYYPPPGQPQPPMAPTAPGYAATTYYPSPGQAVQQPQQFVVAQGAPGTVVVAAPEEQKVSLVMHIVLSCFVFWCCGVLCGCLAFILAMIGLCTSPKTARKLGIASLTLSIIGIVLGLIVIFCTVAVDTGVWTKLGLSCPYRMNGKCYAVENFSMSESECEMMDDSYYEKHGEICYYN